MAKEWLSREEANVHISMGGVALLLVLLLLTTPFFMSSGVSGTLFDRGELLVDYVPNATTNGTVLLYVDSPGQVRFDSISMGVNMSVQGDPSVSSIAYHWDRWFNVSNRVVVNVTLTNVTYFAVTISAVYSGSSSPSYLSSGIFVFKLLLANGQLQAYPASPSLPISGWQTWSWSNLPQTLALAYAQESGT
jgi:hypothetical protein